jgi:DNA-binding NarL/FixJ family response regulator
MVLVFCESRQCTEYYKPNMCIAVVTDLIFQSRITGTAAQAHVACRVVRDVQALESALVEQSAKLVLIDLSVESVGVKELVDSVRQHAPAARIVAFGSHVDREVLDAAAQAGADDVLPRSAFVRLLPALLSQGDS